MTTPITDEQLNEWKERFKRIIKNSSGACFDENMSDLGEESILDCIAEIRRLRDKLPKTADGVTVVPGMRVYTKWPEFMVRGVPEDQAPLLIITEAVIESIFCDYNKNPPALEILIHVSQFSGGSQLYPIYSTREAAENARGEG